VLLGLLYEGRHLWLSVRWKITVNVFYSTFTNDFYFVTFFYVFNVFLFWGERIFHLWSAALLHSRGLLMRRNWRWEGNACLTESNARLLLGLWVTSPVGCLPWKPRSAPALRSYIGLLELLCLPLYELTQAIIRGVQALHKNENWREKNTLRASEIQPPWTHACMHSMSTSLCMSSQIIRWIINSQLKGRSHESGLCILKGHTWIR